ncbi:hypothetical protein BCR44DRAFT_1430071 [Catenaria anguillulae PL171]|uniref:Pre-mRNA processing factor 3-domain-containing protein n=1 Tax=Catenaria anguillulae PL171 TaxID=765915 RepID=A0A1Y2HTB3_9FUNG|nr:hypothetical protein BCR44DRAFT_1430071 [Catenaria anguillulae PL171]
MYLPPSAPPNDRKRPAAESAADDNGSASKRPRVGTALLEAKKRELASRGVLPMPGAAAASLPATMAASTSSSAAPTVPAPAPSSAAATTLLDTDRPRLDRSAPYFDRSLGIPSSLLRGRGGGRRGGKLHFVPQGKYIAKADKLRKEEKLAALKASLSATMKKVGVDASALDVIPDEVVKRAAPPLVEWWDMPLTHGYTTYESMVGHDNDNVPPPGDQAFYMFDTPVPMAVQAASGSASASEADHQVVTPITHFIQHPQERRKLRRQRRMEEQREKQDKIRLGLLAPDPPKDPTAVEANVRAQRKLTDEQRRDKKERKKKRDEAKGIHVAVFKCRDMAHPKIKFKVDMNVKQLGLTGLAVMFKDHHVVCVEGGPRAIRHFKKLMLRRIKWVGIDDEDGGAGASANVDEAGDSEDEGDDDAAPGGGGGAYGVTASGSHFAGMDPSLQHCWLIWEGEHSHRLFDGFSFRKCYLESAAAKLFAEADAEHHWNHAKSWNPPRYT